MSAYYNEFDPFAAEWLRRLILFGHIAPGDVDERSIEDVNPDDLRGYTQCHFFAGIGVWSYALRLAGWPDDRPVWTGSCPCQPFSAAGKGDGFADERHLWPAFFHLIRERRPRTFFGEQVSDRGGPAWLDLVQADLEGEDFAVGPLGLCSAGVGGSDRRHRFYFVGHALGAGLEGHAGHVDGAGSRALAAGSAAETGAACVVADTDPAFGRSGEPGRHDTGGASTGRHEGDGSAAERGGTGGLDDAERDGRGARGRNDAEHDGLFVDATGAPIRPGPVNGFWRTADWISCRDQRWRPVEPGTFPLADGAPARVGRLRGYGNAINAQVAAHFIREAMKVLP